MVLRLKGNPTIDNLQNYPAETVEKLRELLAAGALASPDPHRKDFYDLRNGSRMFYIHICPSGRVWLLATWLMESQQRPAEGQEFVAQASL